MPVWRPSSRATGSTSSPASTTSRRPTKPRHRPVRTCVACRQTAGKGELVRLVRRPAGEIALDRGGRAPGRGAYLHADPACVQMARKRRAVERALGGPVPDRVWEALGFEFGMDGILNSSE